MNQAEIEKKIVDNLEYCPAGIHCYFIKLNSEWGVKCYHDKSSFETAYERQKLCYEEGLAPEVGESFEIDVDFYDEEEHCQIDKLYCYVTELIKPCVSILGKNADYIDAMCEKFQDEYEKDLWLIQQEIRDKTGWYPEDIHGFNWGWNDGKLQLLDFI